MSPKGSEPEKADGQQTPESISTLTFRHVAGFVALLAILDLWSLRHLGYGIRNPPFLAGVLLVIGGAWKFASSFLDEAEQESVQGGVRAIGRAFFSSAFLVWGYSLAVLLVLAVSSIQVSQDRPPRRNEVVVTPLDMPSVSDSAVLDASDRVVVIWVVTSPFGRTFEVSVHGYVPRSFDVFPGVGRRVRLGQDLVPSPTVLFRPPHEVFPSLVAEGEFRLSRVDGSQARVIATRAVGQSSILVGPRRSIPPEVLASWWLLLQAEGLDSDDLAKVRLFWQNHVTLDPGEDLAPETRWRAELYSAEERLLAIGEVTLGTEPFTDVPMQKVES